MGTDRPDQPARPTLDQDLYVYSEEDLGEVAAELLAVIREYPGLSDAEAEEIADYQYDLLTGDFATQDTDGPTGPDT